MALPNSYTYKTGAIPAYFDAILGAEAPVSNVNYFVRLASIMMAAFSVSLFHCFVASVDNYLLPV